MIRKLHTFIDPIDGGVEIDYAEEIPDLYHTVEEFEKAFNEAIEKIRKWDQPIPPHILEQIAKEFVENSPRINEPSNLAEKDIIIDIMHDTMWEILNPVEEEHSDDTVICVGCGKHMKRSAGFEYASPVGPTQYLCFGCTSKG